jgi:hypothetical protein
LICSPNADATDPSPDECVVCEQDRWAFGEMMLQKKKAPARGLLGFSLSTRFLKPELIAQFERAGVKEVIEQMTGSARHLSRQDMCKLGKMTLRGP